MLAMLTAIYLLAALAFYVRIVKSAPYWPEEEVFGEIVELFPERAREAA
jgi:hypothetical protein